MDVVRRKRQTRTGEGRGEELVETSGDGWQVVRAPCDGPVVPVVVLPFGTGVHGCYPRLSDGVFVDSVQRRRAVSRSSEEA